MFIQSRKKKNNLSSLVKDIKKHKKTRQMQAITKEKEDVMTERRKSKTVVIKSETSTMRFHRSLGIFVIIFTRFSLISSGQERTQRRRHEESVSSNRSTRRNGKHHRRHQSTSKSTLIAAVGQITTEIINEASTEVNYESSSEASYQSSTEIMNQASTDLNYQSSTEVSHQPSTEVIYQSYTEPGLSMTSALMMKWNMLLINILKSIGPRIEPCGTPFKISFHSLVVLSILTFCCRLVRYDYNNFKLFVVIPYASSFATNTS